MFDRDIQKYILLNLYNITMQDKQNLKQVGFRLTLELLDKIDAEAKENYRDRTGEIVAAISQYYKLKEERDNLILSISSLTERVDRLEKEIEILKKK